ncbi:unnamed protein product [Camellia sinensis]
MGLVCEMINFMEKLVLGATPASELIGGGCVGGELAGTCVTASAAVVTGGVVGVGQITASVVVMWADGVLDDVGKIYVVTKLQQEIVMVHGSKKCGSGVKVCVEVQRAAKVRLPPAGEAELLS